MSRAEMAALGWEACDIILVTGDAYVDHPSFGMALVGRLLEAHGWKVGIISQPDWRSADDFRALGRPRLYFGVTAGNMDSMVNRYTSERKIRSDDAYTPDGAPGKRPDRAVTVYAQRAREAFPGTTVMIGSIEASLRRIAHYDYWSDTVRRPVLADAKADILLYGNAERALIDFTRRFAAGEAAAAIRDLRGTAFMTSPGWRPEGWTQIDATALDKPLVAGKVSRTRNVVRLPSFEQVKNDKRAYAHASRVFHLESNPGNARALVQRVGDGPGARDIWLNPPPLPLSTAEMDFVYGLPYARRPHPAYDGARIPAWEMIRFSVNIMRGCFGGCTFCSITEHEGRIVQNRSQASILREIAAVRDHTPGFRGHVTDLGGPTANMYRMRCKDASIEAACRRLSCVWPEICPRLDADHAPLIDLYRAARAVPGIEHITIGSGLRYDLAVRSPEYIAELAAHHVSGLLKVAPEHSEPGPLAHMMKPAIDAFDAFAAQFERASRRAGKKQHLVPYFIAAHPGASDEDMLKLALWLKARGFRPDQVQTFLPTPLALATAMYHSGINPLKSVASVPEPVASVRGERQRRLHKAFLRWHDPANWPLLREALAKMGRGDLIGSGARCLVPRR
ncbi:MAG: YgiQ family radical SAM protein [Azoarcus sp.]|nr:YgiQ family radical SAM protein [Azoarcus sp.]